MPKLYTITESPFEDDETPLSYEEDAFVSWVDEFSWRATRMTKIHLSPAPRSASIF